MKNLLGVFWGRVGQRWSKPLPTEETLYVNQEGECRTSGNVAYRSNCRVACKMTVISAAHLKQVYYNIFLVNCQK